MARGEKVGETWRFTCPTSASEITGQDLAIESVSAQRLRWWQRITRKSKQMMSTTKSVLNSVTRRLLTRISSVGTLGLKAEFRKDGDADLIELEIENGRPVLVGWLHYGNLLLGEPPMCDGMSCGHWSVISGYAGKHSNDPEWIMQDPNGLPDMVKGGHKNPHLGRNARMRQAEFYQRWQSEGPGTGWVILVDDE